MTNVAKRIDLRACESNRDAPAIQRILNDVIEQSTAPYDYEPRDLPTVESWIEQKLSGGWPIIGAFDRGNCLLGFATFGPFRPQPAYKYTVEHSIYICQHARGQGIAATLMKALITRALEKDFHTLVGCIDTNNHASIALHKKFGFTHSGTITQAGFKFGRWLDAAFYQLRLPTPSCPVDG